MGDDETRVLLVGRGDPREYVGDKDGLGACVADELAAVLRISGDGGEP
jgi:phosphopantothenoylcysteine decarboxylase/phosphopantothenate--cysteine ligase